MVSMYFQLAHLEESSSQQQLVIVLWPPADLLITQRTPRQRRHSPTLRLLGLPGVEGGSWRCHRCTWLQEEEEGPQHPILCPSTEQCSCLYEGALGPEKDRKATTAWEDDSVGMVTEVHSMGRAGGLSTLPAGTLWLMLVEAG